MKEKIRKIIDKYQIHTSIGIEASIDVCDEWDEETMNIAIDELNTLIQQERKEAVEGFVNYTMSGTTNDNEDLLINYNDLKQNIEEYLQSLDKGDTDENR